MDDTQLTGATVTIDSLVAGDLLDFINDGSTMGAITGSYNSGTGVLTLSGTATLAQYQAALRTVTYRSTSDDPTVNASRTSRTISWQITDANSDLAAAATSTAVTSTVQMIRVLSITPTNARTVEGDPMAFTVTLSAAPNSPMRVAYTLTGGTATPGRDYDPTPIFSNSVTYNASTGLLTIPTGVSSFTVTYTTLDDLMVEGSESVVVQIGTQTASGLITDGAGASIAVSSPTVNEGSPYAMFRVDGVEGQEIKLTLQDYGSGQTPAPGTTAADLSADIGSQLQIFNGTGWQNYTPNSYVTYPIGSSMLLVRIPVINDNHFEGSESFKLLVEGKAVDSSASDDSGTAEDIGIGIINDAGQGPIFNISGAIDYNASKDDDRGLKISNININEGSHYGVVTITGDPGQPLSLALANTASTTDRDATLAGFSIEYSTDNGNSWIPYTWNGTTGDRPTLPPGRIAYVRIDIRPESDLLYEGAETFELIATPDGGSPSIGLAQILDDGTGLIFTGAISSGGQITTRIGLDDDLDKDGIDPNIEEILATLSASSGGGGSPGDLNNDGIPDAEQSAVATLAWFNADYFNQALEGQLTDIRPIISISVETDTDPLTSSGTASDARYQLQAVSVVPKTDGRFGGKDPAASASAGQTIDAPWDPILFDVAQQPSRPSLDDADPDRDGVQVVVTIDIARSGIKEGDFNAYLKFVSAAALTAAGGTLNDLDGNAITTEGWYDFTQRINSSGDYIGDGARFIVVETVNGEHLITKIQLTFTDNAFGDNAIGTNGISDPGLPVKMTTVTATPTASGSQPAVTTPGVTTPVLTPEPTTTPPLEDQGTEIALNPMDLPSDRSVAIPAGPTVRARILAVPNTTTTTSAATVTVASSGGDDGSGSGGSAATASPLAQQVQQAREVMLRWAREAGLMEFGSAVARVSHADAPGNGQQQVRRERSLPLLSQKDDLSALGPNLLEALALGAAGLYFTQVVGRQSLDQVAHRWWQRLVPTKRGKQVPSGMHNEVLAVFVLATGGQPGKLVAARVLADAIEILAEQPLRLSDELAAGRPTASAELWDQLDLSIAMERLAHALQEQEQPHFELLLLDPSLQREREHLQDLADSHTLLRHPHLHPGLLDLASGDQALLRQWLNQPSRTDLHGSEGCRQVMAQLADLQSHWAEYMSQNMANVAGVLELSIALSNLQPLYAVI